MSTLDGHTMAKALECQKKAHDVFVACLHIEDTDRNKHGSFATHLQRQFSLGDNQCPKDITSASNVLSNHSFDAACQEKKKRGKDIRDYQSRSRSFGCTFWSHFRHNTEERKYSTE